MAHITLGILDGGCVGYFGGIIDSCQVRGHNPKSRGCSFIGLRQTRGNRKT